MCGHHSLNLGYRHPDAGLLQFCYLNLDSTHEEKYMASKLIELADGTLVEIEVSESKAQPIAGGAAEKLQDATIDKVKPILLKACKPIIEVWEELNKDMHVEQAEVELGLGVEAEGNLYITKAKGNANLVVTLTLKPKSNGD